MSTLPYVSEHYSTGIAQEYVDVEPTELALVAESHRHNAWRSDCRGLPTEAIESCNKADQDATAAEPVTFNNAIVGVSLSVASIPVHSSAIMVQIETRLITEDDIMPVDTSLVVLRKVIAKLPMTSC